MLTSVQRAKLRSMATAVKPIFQIGKDGGLGENQTNDIKAALEARELIKITVLKSADVSARELLDTLAAATKSEAVTAIGNKIVLYKRSAREDVKHIEL